MNLRIFGACVALIILGVLISQRGAELETLDGAPRVYGDPVFSEEPADSVLSDTMLAGYAGENTSAVEDLAMMAHYIDSVFLLVKERDTADYSTNEDLVLFLHGNNSHRMPFLAKNGSALNGKGQLVDRWNSPLIPHPISRKLLELRSAGPDKIPYTEDDLLWPDRE
ncbi:MAG: hypothetical protein L7W40_09120 [Akkermansiaceae bacterium]|nr:hypothetical protein [Akkermansiaceae bacterium]